MYLLVVASTYDKPYVWLKELSSLLVASNLAKSQALYLNRNSKDGNRYKVTVLRKVSEHG